MTENRHYPQRQINLPRHETVRDPRPSSLAAAIARSRRASRAAILAMKRSGSSSSRAALTASSQRLAAETARSRRASRAAILASRRAVPQQTGRGLSNDPFLLVRSHYEPAFKVATGSTAKPPSHLFIRYSRIQLEHSRTRHIRI